MILQRFRLTVVPHSTISRSVQVTLAPRYGLPMIVARQDRCFECTPVRGNVHQMVDLSSDNEMIINFAMARAKRAMAHNVRRAA
jgi:hypothetical protein